MMYKLSPLNTQGKQDCVQRTTDGACIPFDPDNTDYQEYLKFIADGGQPLPADEVTA